MFEDFSKESLRPSQSSPPLFEMNLGGPEEIATILEAREALSA